MSSFAVAAPAVAVPTITAMPAPNAAPGTLIAGYGAVFGEWTQIRDPGGSAFLERLAPGCFARTLQDRGSRVRCLFQHGGDPVAGKKPLGVIVDLAEDSRGLRYAVDPFWDMGYVRDLRSALATNQLGASFSFRTLVEDFEPRPKRSSWNVDRLPEVTIRECELFELGPVTFGAYPSATAGLRAAGETPRLTLVEPQRDRSNLFWFTEPPKGAKPKWHL